MTPPVVLSPTWQLLHTLVGDLIELRGELVELLMAEKTERIEAYAASQETTDAGRKRDADFAALTHWRDRVKVEAQIQQKEELHQFLTLAITHGVEVVEP